MPAIPSLLHMFISRSMMRSDVDVCSLLRRFEDECEEALSTLTLGYCTTCISTAFKLTMAWVTRGLGYICIAIGCIALFPLALGLSLAFVVFELSQDE